MGGTPEHEHEHEDLRAESCLIMEDALDKITKLLRCDLALAADPNAARVSDHLQIQKVIKSLNGKIFSLFFKLWRKYIYEEQLKLVCTSHIISKSHNNQHQHQQRNIFDWWVPRRPCVQPRRVGCLHAPSSSWRRVGSVLEI